MGSVAQNKLARKSVINVRFDQFGSLYSDRGPDWVARTITQGMVVAEQNLLSHYRYADVALYFFSTQWCYQKVWLALIPKRYRDLDGKLWLPVSGCRLATACCRLPSVLGGDCQSFCLGFWFGCGRHHHQIALALGWMLLYALMLACGLA